MPAHEQGVTRFSIEVEVVPFEAAGMTPTMKYLYVGTALFAFRDVSLSSTCKARSKLQGLVADVGARCVLFVFLGLGTRRIFAVLKIPLPNNGGGIGLPNGNF